MNTVTIKLNKRSLEIGQEEARALTQEMKEVVKATVYENSMEIEIIVSLNAIAGAHNILANYGLV